MNTETTTTEPLTRSDMVQIRRAFRHGWPVTAERRKTIIAELKAVVNDPRRPERERQSAANTLAIISGGNEGAHAE